MCGPLWFTSFTEHDVFKVPYVVSLILSFLLLNHISLYGYVIDQMDVWVVSTLGFMNVASKNICVQMCEHIFFVSLRYIHRSEIAWLCGSSVFNHVRKCRTLFSKSVLPFYIFTSSIGGVQFLFINTWYYLSFLL